MKKPLIATCTLLLCIAAMADTFYLQADKGITSGGGGNPLYWETYQGIWWDATTGGNLMGTATSGAEFVGHRFELNGFRYNSWNGTSNVADLRRKFYGTLVKDNAPIHNFTQNWVMNGFHVTADSTSTSSGLLLRRTDGLSNLSVGSFLLDGNLTVRGNTTEHDLTLKVTDLSGAGTLQFGRDDTSAEDGGSTWKLDIDNSSFAGTIRADVGDLEFTDTIALPNATLFVDAGSTYVGVILSNNVTFGDVRLGGTFLPDGEYTASEANNFLGGSRFSGSGTITVIPEPATLGLVGMVSAAMLFIRRRFMI